MDHCIYHSRDLDGMTSGAIIFNSQTAFGDDCYLTGYDYGQKLDTRIFKGKSTIMIDVSMPMDRMELLGKNCQQFFWVDHHQSAYDQLHEYCQEKGYKMIKNKYNDLIERIEVHAMNLIYFFATRISACEATSILYGKQLAPTARKLVSALGQYDTWRNTEDKMFASDLNWEKEVMPLQYFMRSFETPFEINKVLKSFSGWDNVPDFDKLIEIGSHVYQYQSILNKTVAKKHFEFEYDGIRIIALNTNTFNSGAFHGFYHLELHDAMMPFAYNGKLKKWEFSLYTTKEEIDILSIAKRFGGGGHRQACGFALPQDSVQFSDDKIWFINEEKKTYEFVNKPEQTATPNPADKPSKKGHIHKVDGDTDYLIPNFRSSDFDNLQLTDRPKFDERYSKFIVTQTNPNDVTT